MIQLHARFTENLTVKDELLAALQAALLLEHATVPLYLQATWSLPPTSVGVPDTNKPIRNLIRDIAMEEMLHMNLVANLINALGGQPVMNTPDFLMAFPGRLPGTIQTSLEVHLRAFSKKQVEEVFMEIEEPEKPKEFKLKAFEGFELPATSVTIGQFYGAIRKAIADGNEAELFTGDASRQIAINVDDDEGILVTDKATALAAIDMIIEQGEGNDSSPLESATGEPAHYYRFQGILKGRVLQADASVSEGYSFSGDAVPFNPAAVTNVKDNVRISDLVGTPAEAPAREFNRAYTGMLADLHLAFNGDTDAMDRAVNTMYTLGAMARKLMRFEITSGVFAGPTWEYDASPVE
jgi:hypothetical protein